MQEIRKKIPRIMEIVLQQAQQELQRFVPKEKSVIESEIAKNCYPLLASIYDLGSHSTRKFDGVPTLLGLHKNKVVFLHGEHITPVIENRAFELVELYNQPLRTKHTGEMIFPYCRVEYIETTEVLDPALLTVYQKEDSLHTVRSFIDIPSEGGTITVPLRHFLQAFLPKNSHTVTDGEACKLFKIPGVIDAYLLQVPVPERRSKKVFILNKPGAMDELLPEFELAMECFLEKLLFEKLPQVISLSDVDISELHKLAGREPVAKKSAVNHLLVTMVALAEEVIKEQRYYSEYGSTFISRERGIQLPLARFKKLKRTIGDSELESVIFKALTLNNYD